MGSHGIVRSSAARNGVIMSMVFGRVVGVVLLALSLTACQSDEQKLAEHMRRGDAYFEEGEFGEASIEYRNVLQIDPNQADAHFKLAKSYFKDGKLKEGFWELREAVRLDPENIDATVWLAQVLVVAKELDEALTYIDAAIAAAPDRFDAQLVRAQVLEGLKRTDEALESFKKAVELKPDSWDAVNQYALALERSGSREAAEEWFAKLIEAAPEARSYAAYGRFLIRSRDEERRPEVTAMFRKAIAAATPEEVPRAYLALVTYLYSIGSVDEALATLEEGIEKSDDKLELIYAMARYKASQGDQEEAEALIEKAAASAPDQAGPLLILSAYRDRQGDMEGALEAAQRAVEVEPDNLDAKLRVAEVMIGIGVKQKKDDMISQGLEIVDAILTETEEENAAALVIKAKADLYHRKAADAIAGLRAAVNLRPEWGQAHFVLGTALLMDGDVTAARSELARALELDPSLLQARRVLAQVHADLRENDYAIEEGRRYLRERPDDHQLRILVAQSLLRRGDMEAAERELAMIPEAERNAEVNYAYGRINMGKREWDAAHVFLLAALDDLPTNYDILNSLYLTEFEQGDTKQAVSRVTAALESEPDNAKLHLLLGSIALRQHRGEDAEASFKKAIELEPDDLAAYEHLARYYASTARLQEAIDTYEAAAATRPDAAQIFHLLGVLYELGGQRQKAIANYEKAVRLAPSLGEAKNNLAYLLADSGENLDRALELAQEAKALLPDSSNAADTLGWVLFKRGVPGAAIAYLKEAEAGIEPGNPSLSLVRYHLAQAYASNGDDEQAAATLERALAEVEQQIEASRKRGVAADEPDWVSEARAMLARLQTS